MILSYLRCDIPGGSISVDVSGVDEANSILSEIGFDKIVCACVDELVDCDMFRSVAIFVPDQNPNALTPSEYVIYKD